jgi:hypothetical protein
MPSSLLISLLALILCSHLIPVAYLPVHTESPQSYCTMFAPVPECHPPSSEQKSLSFENGADLSEFSGDLVQKMLSEIL